MEKVISIFGSGLTTSVDKYYNEIVELGKLISLSGYTICNGGYYGTMEAASKGAHENNGKSIGITVAVWDTKPNKYNNDIVKMPNLSERLMELVTLGDAYLVLKGGSGTLIEIASTLELMNKGLMREKLMIFYQDFWKCLVEILLLDSDRLKNIILQNVKFIQSPAEISKVLKNYFENDTYRIGKELKNIKY